MGAAVLGRAVLRIGVLTSGSMVNADTVGDWEGTRLDISLGCLVGALLGTLLAVCMAVGAAVATCNSVLGAYATHTDE